MKITLLVFADVFVLCWAIAAAQTAGDFALLLMFIGGALFENILRSLHGR